MKKLLGILVLGLLWCNTIFAEEFLAIVKNNIDENVFIKRTKPTKEEAIQSALEGCYVLYKFREDLKKKKRLDLMEARYVFKVVDQ
jgi:hypothetical protein